MKAAVYHQYGRSEQLRIEKVEPPVPKENEVLVKVVASSVNDWDWSNLRGVPRMYRMAIGITKPKFKILGCDVAGFVVKVGSKVTKLKSGDEVFGDLCASGFGAFAELACASEETFLHKPASMSFEQAACLPQAAALALQGLFDKKKVEAGQKILINGAGGGSGTIALQVAKSYGAEVTGVDSAEKLETMLQAGASDVLDYAQEDFTKQGRTYDLILNNAAEHSIFDYRRCLNPGGCYVVVGGKTGRIFQTIALGPWLSMAGSRKMSLLLHKPNQRLDQMIELFEADKVKPVIDRCYPLTGIAEAMRYFGEGHAKGKVVITMDQ